MIVNILSAAKETKTQITSRDITQISTNNMPNNL
jgi:hypothetical protein